MGKKMNVDITRWCFKFVVSNCWFPDMMRNTALERIGNAMSTGGSYRKVLHLHCSTRFVFYHMNIFTYSALLQQYIL